MSTQTSLSLARRFEPSHPPPPYSGRLMGLLCSIMLILLSAVDRIGNQLTFCLRQVRGETPKKRRNDREKLLKSA
ncbi:MAG: hypothetical protein ACI9B9_000479 [Halioglobus sp.]|jgi:hypothetical protein